MTQMLWGLNPKCSVQYTWYISDFLLGAYIGCSVTKTILANDDHRLQYARAFCQYRRDLVISLWNTPLVIFSWVLGTCWRRTSDLVLTDSRVLEDLEHTICFCSMRFCSSAVWVGEATWTPKDDEKMFTWEYLTLRVPYLAFQATFWFLTHPNVSLSPTGPCSLQPTNVLLGWALISYNYHNNCNVGQQI